MANLGNEDKKKTTEPEKDVEEISSVNSSLNELAQHAEIGAGGDRNVSPDVAAYDVSAQHIEPIEADWSSVDIPMFGEMPITDSEASTVHTEDPFPCVLPHLEPFLQRLEFERHCMLERSDTSDEALKQHWYNLTAERDHIFRIMFCEENRFSIAEDLDKLEKISLTVLKQATCPDAIMGYLRTQIRKLLRLISFAKVHLRSENGHHPNIAYYPSKSPELITDSSDPSDLLLLLEDVGGSVKTRSSRPIASRSQQSSFSRIMSSQQSSFSRGTDSMHSISHALTSSSSGPSGPSASTGAISKRPQQSQANPYPTIEEVSFTSSVPESRPESTEVTSPPINPLQSLLFSKNGVVSPRKRLPRAQILPCVPVNSSEERLSLPSLGDTDLLYSSTTDSDDFVFKFANTLNLGLREHSEADGIAELQPQGSFATQAMVATSSLENIEERRAPVRFYIGDEPPSSSSPSEELDREQGFQVILVAAAEGAPVQQRREESESSDDFCNLTKTDNQKPS